jgi:hypothetical protein
VRFGKVKTPSGLFNEIQDIDPSYMWSLLPQGIYPITSHNGILTHYGGVAYGTLKLGQNLGKLEYRGWGGERVLASNDGYFVSSHSAGTTFPSGMSWAIYGGALRWRTPLAGLMVGASNFKAPTHSTPRSKRSPSMEPSTERLRANPKTNQTTSPNTTRAK